MNKKNTVLTILGAAIIISLTAAASYFFFTSENKTSIDTNNNNPPINVVDTPVDDKETAWRTPANISNVSFENIELKNTYEYDNEKVSFYSGWIKNPATDDKQSVRIYSVADDGDGLLLVVLVPGGTNDGTDYEATPPNRASNAVQLAAEGFVVIVYSPLGTGESEGTMNYQGFDDQDGLAAIIAAGKKLEGIDTNNISIASFSYGITGATGVLARYPDLNIKFYSDWEGPSSRTFTSVDCRSGATKKPDSVGSFSCDDSEHWAEREAVNFIKKANLKYYWRIQQEKDHVQKTYGHTLEMMKATVGNIPWVKLNDSEINPEYITEEDLDIVKNYPDYFGVYVIPHLKEMAEME